MAGEEGEALLQVANQLCAELGRRPSAEWLAAAAPTFGGLDRPPTTKPGLSRSDEELVRAMKLALAEIASAASSGSLPDERQRVVRAALDGAELVIRGQLAMGTPEQLRMLLPSMIFLIALPLVRQGEALAISRRAGELVDKAFGRGG